MVDIICPPPPVVEIGLTDLKKLGGPFRRPCITLEYIPHPFFSIAIKGTSQSQVANYLVANSQLAYSFAKKKYQKTQVGGIFARFFKKKLEKSKANHFLI